VEDTFRLWLGVTLGGVESGEFDDGATEPVLTLEGDVLEVGKGVRGRSEIGPSELEVKETFIDGVELGIGNGERPSSDFVPVTVWALPRSSSTSEE
jgi:hypothetical protein